MPGEVRRGEAAALGGPAAQSGRAGAAPPPPPLRVSGMVVRKDDLMGALRIYVPALRDLQVTEDGAHCWLLLGEPEPVGDPAAS